MAGRPVYSPRMSAEEDLNELLNDAVDVATDMLAKASEFVPFALAMQPDGEVFHIEPEEEDQGGDPEAILDALRLGLREAAMKGRWKAVAVVADITVEDDDGEAMTAAIHIAMEHLDGDPVTCIVPYAIADDAVELDELYAEPGEPAVFRPQVLN